MVLHTDHNDMLQITDINTVIYQMSVCKNLVHTSTTTAVHNLTSENDNIDKSFFIKDKRHIYYNIPP